MAAPSDMQGEAHPFILEVKISILTDNAPGERGGTRVWRWNEAKQELQMLKFLSISAALSFFLVSSALAQPRFGACAADIKKVCANVTPGGGRIGACIKEHLKDLSDACKTRLSKAAAGAKVCGEDVKKQCGSVSGRVRKAVCIKDALAGLDDDCKAAMAAAVARKE